MGSEVKPLPCPAVGCGGEGLVSARYGEFVHCSRCNMRGPLAGGTEEAVIAWNEIAALRARVRELTEAMEYVQMKAKADTSDERSDAICDIREEADRVLTPPRAEEAERA